MLAKYFLFLSLFFIVNTKAEVLHFYNINYLVNDQDTFSSVLKKFVKDSSIINSQTPFILKTRSLNPSISDWDNLPASKIIKLSISEDFIDLTKLKNRQVMENPSDQEHKLYFFLLEPYIGENLNFSNQLKIFTNFGIRSAMNYKQYAMGFDYGFSKFSDSTISDTGTFLNDFKRSNKGVFFSFSFNKKLSPSKFRFSPIYSNKLWLIYLFDITDTVNSSNDLYKVNNKLQGAGVEIGFSKNIFSILDGHISVRSIRLTKFTDNNNTSSFLTGNNIQNLLNLELGLSLPLSF